MMQVSFWIWPIEQARGLQMPTEINLLYRKMLSFFGCGGGGCCNRRSRWIPLALPSFYLCFGLRLSISEAGTGICVILLTVSRSQYELFNLVQQ